MVSGLKEVPFPPYPEPSPNNRTGRKGVCRMNLLKLKTVTQSTYVGTYVPKKSENTAAAALGPPPLPAAAVAKCDDPWILRTVLVAAAATANALAQTGAQDAVQAHRRGLGGRPRPMRRANPGARPRRNRRPAGTAPRARGSRTLPTNQPRQHDPPMFKRPPQGQEPQDKPTGPSPQSGA